MIQDLRGQLRERGFKTVPDPRTPQLEQWTKGDDGNGTAVLDIYTDVSGQMDGAMLQIYEEGLDGDFFEVRFSPTTPTAFILHAIDFAI